MAASQVRSTSIALGPVMLPSGRSLPAESWERRHRGILVVLALHAVGLVLFGLRMGVTPQHALLEGGVIGAFALAAWHPRLERRVRSVAAAVGLMTCSAVLTHLSGGYIEAHFHFFVMLGVIFLYEDWLPYMLAVGYVAVHHGVAGMLDPLSVYNHPEAIAHPWKWAGIHAVFIFGLSAALIVAWNVIEHARDAQTRALSEAQELKRQLHTQEKMAALGSLVSGLAHEVRTPLTVVGTSAELLDLAAKRDPANPLAARVRSEAAEIRAGVDRINALVLQLRKFHALQPNELRVEALDGVVREAMRLYASVNKSARTLELDLASTPPARLHPLGVHQVVLNLVANAVDATDPVNGVVTVRTRSEDGHAVLEVEDNGVGMDEDTARKAFDPLFTTKAEGMGLGLHIVKRIVEAHAGTVRCSSTLGQGTTFAVRFPLAEAKPSAPPLHDAARGAPEALAAS